MTGRGMGMCATPMSGAAGWGRGRFRSFGWGRGAGFGRGFGVGRSFCGPVAPVYPSAMGAEEERTLLRDEARAMEEELKRIQARIEELGE